MSDLFKIEGMTSSEKVLEALLLRTSDVPQPPRATLFANVNAILALPGRVNAMINTYKKRAVPAVPVDIDDVFTPEVINKIRADGLWVGVAPDNPPSVATASADLLAVVLRPNFEVQPVARMLKIHHTDYSIILIFGDRQDSVGSRAQIRCIVDDTAINTNRLSILRQTVTTWANDGKLPLLSMLEWELP